MIAFKKFLIVWEDVTDTQLAKVTIANIRSDHTVFQHASKMLKTHGVVLIDHQEVEESIQFSFDNHAEWKTIQDALDAQVIEKTNAI